MIRSPWICLTVVLAVVAACGGSATQTPKVAIQAYVDSVAPAFALAGEEQPDLDSGFAIGSLTPVPEGIDGFNRMIDLRAVLVETLDSVQAPPELKASHEDLVKAANDWNALAGRIVAVLEEADPESTIGTDIADDPELGSFQGEVLQDVAKRACGEIENTAEDKGVEADLGCHLIFRR